MMCSQIRFMTTMLAVFGAGGAYGEEPTSKRSAHFLPLVPTLQFQASSSGESKLQLGLDATAGFECNRRWDYSLRPSFSTKSKESVTQLFDFTGKKAGNAQPWTLGLDVAFIRSPETVDYSGLREIGLLDLDEEKRRIDAEAVNVCRAWFGQIDHPAHQPVTSEDNKFWSLLVVERADMKVALMEFQQASTTDEKDAAQNKIYEISNRLAIIVRDADLCTAGAASRKEKLDRLDARRDEIKRNIQFRFPKWVLSIAGDVGAETFSYYTSDNQPAATLTKQDPVLRWNGGGAFAITFVEQSAPQEVAWLNGFTLEIAGSGSYAWKASGDALKMCHSAGTSGVEAGQVCEDGMLGAPTGSINSQARLLLGYVDTKKAFWRISAGLFYDQTTAPDKLRIGGIVPVYIDLANLKKQNEAIYSGVVRISPAIVAVREKGVWRPQFFVVIDLLGDRTLFGRAVDYL